MFWRFGMQTASSLDGVLERQEIILHEVLDEADLLQECKSKHPKLIE
jgi:hypothetical protein